MRNKPKQFPHIYLRITEHINIYWNKLTEKQKKLVIKWFPFGALALFLLFSTLYPYSDFERARNKVIFDPKNLKNHQELSEVYKKYNALEPALTEARLTRDAREEQSLSSLIAQPGILKSKLKYWQDVINKHPDYRDAYIQKLILSYQLKKTGELNEDLNKIIELDPNHEALDFLKKLTE